MYGIMIRLWRGATDSTFKNSEELSYFSNQFFRGGYKMVKKLNGNMSGMDAILAMSDGNPGAMMVLMGMMQAPTGLMDILMLDSRDIRGLHLYMLNNDYCKRDPDKFSRTMMMIRFGVFTQEQIHKNLERCYALPFIDDSIELDGIPPYGEEFGPDHPKWDEWCEAQKESYERRGAEYDKAWA